MQGVATVEENYKDEQIYIYIYSERERERERERECLVRFCDLSTSVCYLMLNPLYAYILNIYDIWFRFVQ